MISMNACIHAPNINGNPLPAIALEVLLDHGLVFLRLYGSQTAKEKDTFKKFLLLKFEMNNWDDIEHISSVLKSFNAIYCFQSECPNANYGCPAFRPT